MDDKLQIIPIRQAALITPDERLVATWDQMIDAFMNTLESKHTQATYKRVLDKLPLEMGERGPADITGDDLGAWKRSVLDEMEAGQIAPNTAKRQIMTVRSFFKFAHILGQSSVGPDVRKFVLKAPKGVVQKPFIVLSPQEEDDLLDILEGDRKRMVGAMLYAGLRVSELCNLDVGDYYRNGGGKLWVRVRRGKKGKARNVPAGETLAAILGEPGDGDGPMFVSRQMKQNGTRNYTRVRLWQILRGALDNVWSERRKDISPHSLRHTAAMRWLRDGVPLTVISEWLGHSSLDVTKTYLDHLNEDEKHGYMR